VKVIFELDSERDGDHVIKAHQQCMDMRLVLSSFDSRLRSIAKHGEGPEAAFADIWRQELFGLCQDCGVTLDD
jgi:hypothetical protein